MTPRFEYVSEDEADLAHSVLEEYWEKFGLLVAQTLKKMPPELWELTLDRLEEKSSVHGSGYERFLSTGL